MVFATEHVLRRTPLSGSNHRQTPALWHLDLRGLLSLGKGEGKGEEGWAGRGGGSTARTVIHRWLSSDWLVHVLSSTGDSVESSSSNLTHHLHFENSWDTGGDNRATQALDFLYNRNSGNSKLTSLPVSCCFFFLLWMFYLVIFVYNWIFLKSEKGRTFMSPHSILFSCGQTSS